MAHLTINGVELEISHKTGERVFDDLGDEDRAIDGTLVTTRVKLKRRWGITSNPLARATCDAWSGLLSGRGHNWRFTDQYAVKGLDKSATSGSVTYNGASGKFVGGVRVTLGAGAYVRWTPLGDDSLVAGGLNPVGDYTLSVWKLTATGPDVWTNYIVRYLDGATNKWVDGVANDGATTDFITNTAGVVQIGNGTDAAVFSDMFVLPFGIPTAWAVFYGVRTTAFPSLPRVEASGTMLSSPTSPLTVRARNLKETPEPYTADTTGKRLDFDLLEV